MCTGLRKDVSADMNANMNTCTDQDAKIYAAPLVKMDTQPALRETTSYCTSQACARIDTYKKSQLCMHKQKFQ